MEEENLLPQKKRRFYADLSWWRGQFLYYFVLAVVVIGIGVGAYVAYGNLKPLSSSQRYQHIFNACSSADCHGKPAADANIYVAVDGQDVTDNPVAIVGSGDAFELDFHFEGLGGAGKKSKAVGIQVKLPDDTGWAINRGKAAHPAEWKGDGNGRNFWSDAWNYGAGGNGKQLVRWKPSLDKRNVYYADFEGTAWSKDVEAALANDSGSQENGDLDGRAGQMGISAIIGVSLKVKLGDYKIEVAGIGRDTEGKLASVSKTITVQVRDASDPALVERAKRLAQNHEDLTLEFSTFVPPATVTPAVTPTPTPVPYEVQYALRDAPKPWPMPGVEEPATIHGGNNCMACHSAFDVAPAVRALPTDHKGRDQSTCRLCHMRPQMGPYIGTGTWHYIVPRIPHGVAGRDDCLSCHKRPGGIKPVSSTHAGRTSNLCRGCHQLPSNAGGPPLMPHVAEGHADCLSCHGSVPADHEKRKNDVCQVCHIPSDNGPMGMTGYAIPIPHSLGRHGDCGRCHQVFNDPAPTPTPAPAPSRSSSGSARGAVAPPTATPISGSGHIPGH